VPAAASRATVAVDKMTAWSACGSAMTVSAAQTPPPAAALTGLCNRVEALGGSLAVRSPGGQGTSLDVTLPVATLDGRTDASG
jgi:signal transduction histidine kinase